MNFIKATAAQTLERMRQQEIPADTIGETNEFFSEVETLIESHNEWLRLLKIYTSYVQICVTFHLLVKSTLKRVDPEMLSNLSPSHRVGVLTVINQIHQLNLHDNDKLIAECQC